MDKGELKDLLQRYSIGECTKDEAARVENWYIQQESNDSLPISDEELQDHLEAIYNHLPKASRLKANLNWMKAAAVLSFLILSIGIYNYFSKGILFNAESEFSSITNDIAPGGNKATLTLSDGTVLLLDQIKAGEIYQNDNLRIRKTKDGEIEYLASSAPSLNSSQPPIFNQINIPKGGQFQVTLPDGSKVWLNASSTLKYPTSFAASERIVELDGEAYFEVAKSQSPFYVNTKNQRIEVLGTQFNVNAYHDEIGTKTTLLEGSVKIIDKKETNQSIILKPGEQAFLTNNNDIQVSKANIKQAIAWKNGFFNFEGADLKSVMREFSRWYGVEVDFEGTIPNTKLWGEVNRNVPALQALNILKYYDFKFNVVQHKGISKIEISTND